MIYVFYVLVHCPLLLIMVIDALDGLSVRLCFVDQLMILV